MDGLKRRDGVKLRMQGGNSRENKFDRANFNQSECLFRKTLYSRAPYLGIAHP